MMEENHEHHETSSTSDGESHTGGSRSSGDETGDIQAAIIKNEERAVRRAKCLVGASVLLCAVAVLLAVYFLNASSDQRSFELAYDGYVKDIRALVVWEVKYNFALMDQLSAQITIVAGYLNSSFPFHTEPDYEISGGFVDGMGGIMTAGFAPLVKHEQREEWEKYSVENQGWLKKSAYLKAVHPEHRDALHGTIQDHEHDRRNLEEQESISPFIYRWQAGEKVREVSEPGQELAPMWQISPADAGAVNVNVLSDDRITDLYQKMLEAKASVLSSDVQVGDMFDFLFDDNEKQFKTDPHAFILTPVFNEIEEKEDQQITGILIGLTPFGNLLDRLLPPVADGGIVAVLKDRCGGVLSFELGSGKALFLGYADEHDSAFDQYVQVEKNIEMYEDADALCAHDLYLYPTELLQETYTTNSVGIYLAIIGIAVALVLIFAVYDVVVTRRQNKTMQNAMRTRAIVTSLFPERIARKLVNESLEAEDDKKRARMFQTTKTKLESFMNDAGQAKASNEPINRNTKPLAELFPEATIMFGDLVGFTAWSSQREPHQVFTLLETIYSEFDLLASNMGVFKVETIGDCYVAVCGLPNPNKRHAVVMARFAHECYKKMGIVLQQLEVELGPDTAFLGIRVGLHSGPVTAGVLRGERARFQLFGDTVNTTARIEASGEKNRVHLSEATARRLISFGKEHWVQLREDKITAKGKGELTTYWLNMGSAGSGSISRSERGDAAAEIDDSARARGVESITKLADGQSRIVEWNVDLLQRQLKILVANRQAKAIRPEPTKEIEALEATLSNPEASLLEEVKDVIELPKFTAKAALADPRSIELDDVVMSQLRNYVATIASMYRHHPFHNYEHASHVTMSCLKFLSRVVSPEIENSNGSSIEKNLYDKSYGITSDPLIQFSVIFAAMIHDVDHQGVPNMQLEKENHELSTLYNHKSSAEQNSVDVAWTLLMEDAYKDLRRVIYSTKDELKRFRQLVINCVMATDVMDKELGMARKARWAKAFASEIAEQDGNGDSNGNDSVEDVHRKATIVIEHLIQASDVAHTMQHWHVFHRWNERLYREAYAAYKAGRAAKDPADGWYEGEIGFFDYYVIPLAKKLKNCGVFGVSSDECLSYAERNRDEWAQRGRSVVEDYAKRIKEEEAMAQV